MSRKLKVNRIRDLYTFTDGAKLDLMALNHEYSYAQIIANISKSVTIDHKSGNRISGNLVIKVFKKKVLGVTLKHLDKFARHYQFNCDVCFDSKQIVVGDPCEICAGKGCSDCSIGLVFKRVTCPNCIKPKLEIERNDWSNRDIIKRQQSHGNGWPIQRQASRNKRSKAG